MDPLSNQRQRDFIVWIEACAPSPYQLDRPLQPQALAGDAGFRRYYRLPGQRSLIAVDSPPEKENNPAYIAVALCLQRHGITTPKILAVDFARGFMLLEDFGHQLLHRELMAGLIAGENSPERHSADNYYQQAEALLQDIQAVEPSARVFEHYDNNQLQVEMNLFADWFLGQLLGLELSAEERSLLDQLYSHLIVCATGQPQVVVHRDYHSRNLMLLEDGSLGVIDFQDAIVGPITYDLVSLLKDCYLRLPAEQVTERALGFKRCLEQRGTLNVVSDKQFLHWFDLVGLQRHIKVLGIFVRLSLRDGKHGYLHDLPLVIRYTLEAAERHEEGRAFYHWFVQRVEPLLTDQPWYRDWRSAGELAR